MKVLIAIPAFNESKTISDVLNTLPKSLPHVTQLDKLVIDDGSTDDTAQKAHRSGAIVATHVLNRGAGAATKTGMDYARENGYDLLITFDADSQHSPYDIPKLIQPIVEGRAELVIGSRLKKRQPMPTDRLIINWIANLITLSLFGVFSTDSQSGLRAFSKEAISLIDIKSDRMEFSSEILLEAKRHNLRIIEVPVRAIYTDYSKGKGQKNTNAIPIFIRFMTKLLR